MIILCVGDVVGAAGCRCLRRLLPALRRQYGVDVCIVNGENSAEGNGITPTSAEELFNCGADVITTGNHVFRRPEMREMIETHPFILRPANYPAGTPGKGMCVVDKGRRQVTVINLMGVAFMEPLANPFETLDALLKEAGNPAFCVVDFHAEATAEKRALGFYADGKLTALIGTHTHVQTADEQILPGGTGYMTDVGMTGPIQSVLGVVPSLAIDKMKTHLPVRFATAQGECMLNAVLIEADDQTGRAVSIQRLDVR